MKANLKKGQKSVRKPDIVELMHQKMHSRGFADSSTSDVEEGFSHIMTSLIDAITNKKRCEIRTFGVLGHKVRRPQKARNPKDGTLVNVEERSLPSFKASKILKKGIRPEK